MNRTGAGETYNAFESIWDTKHDGAAPSTVTEFDNSPLAVALGGVDGIYHFVSEGDGGRAANDVPGESNSVTTMTFAMSTGFSTPHNTIISLYDPGAVDFASWASFLDGPTTYTFVASLNGVSVNTSSWVMTIQDPYLPDTNHTPYDNYFWNGTSLTIYNYLEGQPYFAADNPDTMVFLDTMNTSFDTLTITVTGLPLDTIGVGLGVQATVVPEPTGALLIGIAGLAALARRRRTV